MENIQQPVRPERQKKSHEEQVALAKAAALKILEKENPIEYSDNEAGDEDQQKSLRTRKRTARGMASKKKVGENLDKANAVNPFLGSENRHIAKAQQELDAFNVSEPQVADVASAAEPTPRVQTEEESKAYADYQDEVYRDWGKTEPLNKPETDGPENVSVPATADQHATKTEDIPELKAEEFMSEKVQAEMEKPFETPADRLEVVEEGLGLKPEMKTEESPLEERIAKLRGEVEAMRAEYVKEDHENTNAWARVQKFFGKTLKGLDEREWQEKGHAEVNYYQAKYMNKLMDLQNLELEQLKQGNLSGMELKEGMGNLLKEVKLGETIKLVDARTQYQAEHRNWPTKALDSFGALGRWYNRLSGAEKIAITAVLLTGAATTAAFGGVAGGALALGINKVRNMMAGSALFVTSETGLEKVAAARRESKADREVAEAMEELTTKERQEPTLETDQKAVEERNGKIIDFDKASAMLKGNIFDLDERLSHEKAWKKVRKGAALGLGVAVGSGWLGQIITEKMGIGTVGSSAEATPSAEAGMASPEIAATEVAAVAPAAEGAASVTPEKISFSLEDYHLTSADGKRGLWGIIDAKLPEDLHGADRVKAIQSLENAIQNKLHDMSPEQLKGLGFPDGDIGKIYAGDTIKFGQILNAQDIDKALSGEYIPGKNVAEAVAGQVGTEAAVPAEGTVSGVVSEPAVRDVSVEDAVRVQEENLINSNPKAYLAENPEMIGQFNRGLGNIRMGIFQTSEIEGMTGLEYQYTENAKALGGAEVGRVLGDYGKLNGNPFTNYDRSLNPLHYSQMKGLDLFTKAAEKALGPLSYAKAGETVDEYTRRIMTIALRTGKEIRF